MTDHLPALSVTQKLTLMVNRYDVHRAGPDGAPGELLATAQQKRMAFREQVTFYADADRSQPVFGTFRKDFGKSLLRSTFHLATPEVEATGRERNQAFAILRRVVDVPLPMHFDFTDAGGRQVMSSDRRFAVRDRYRVEVPDTRLDWRMAAAMAVGLDALMAR